MPQCQCLLKLLFIEQRTYLRDVFAGMKVQIDLSESHYISPSDKMVLVFWKITAIMFANIVASYNGGYHSGFRIESVLLAHGGI